MYTGRIVFSQLMDLLPMHEFKKCVRRYHGDYRMHTFSCLDQFLCMAFAQLTLRESLRDIEACLRAMQAKLYHMGIRGKLSRSTLADANERRDWRIRVQRRRMVQFHGLEGRLTTPSHHWKEAIMSEHAGRVRRARSLRFAFLLALLFCVVCALLDLPNMIKRAVWTREGRLRQAELTRRSRFLLQIYHNVLEERGSFSHVDSVRAEIERLALSTGGAPRKYVLAEIGDRLYVAEVPEYNEETICILDDRGYVHWESPRSELGRAVLARLGADRHDAALQGL